MLQFKKYLILSLLLCITSIGFGQNRLAGILEQQDLYTLNPARTGVNGNINVFALSRYQWAGFDGAPTALQTGVHGELTEKVGLGFQLYNVNEGIEVDLLANFAYRYTLKLEEGSFLNFGISAGIINNSRNIKQLDVQGDIDPALQIDRKQSMFNSGVGVSLMSNEFELDVSMPNLVVGTRSLDITTFSRASYFIEIDESWSVLPALIYKYNDNNSDYQELNVQVRYNNLWIRPGYRYNSGVYAELGTALKNFDIAYAYEYNTGELNNISGGTHEVGVFINLGRKWKKEPEKRAFTKGEGTVLSSQVVEVSENSKKMNSHFDSLSEINGANSGKNQGEDDQADIEDLSDEELATIDGEETSLLSPGFYTVVFAYNTQRDGDIALRVLRKKEPQAQLVYVPGRKLYYIYLEKFYSKSEALDRMRELRTQGYEDCWVKVYLP
ncbi:MAG: type IX secretion system PorP/SprF family membrane protein [Sphingobacteriales bacterium]|jgi:type IX secretion system PorP/SprF family membrane protein